ncbi:MAG: histidine--tRNA ligase, partial [Rubrivivax sp.]
ARYALVFGEDELSRGEVAVKALRDPSAVQRSLPLARVAEWAASLRNA